MNANYLYKVFEKTEEAEVNDLTVGLAMLQATDPIPDGLTEMEINQFIGAYYKHLVQAFEPHNKATFTAVVEDIVKNPAKYEKKKGKNVVHVGNTPNMARNMDRAGLVVEEDGFAITYNEDGYAAKAIRIKKKG